MAIMRELLVSAGEAPYCIAVETAALSEVTAAWQRQRQAPVVLTA